MEDIAMEELFLAYLPMERYDVYSVSLVRFRQSRASTVRIGASRRRRLSREASRVLLGKKWEE